MIRFPCLLVCGFLCSSVMGENCPYKECYCADVVMYCDERNLKAIPQLLVKTNMSIKTVQFDDNGITTIPAQCLPRNLSEVSLKYNPIETIDNAAFDDSNNTLETLSFSKARFTQLPEAVLHLRTLKRLSIHETIIRVWNDDAMKQLGSTMEALDLDTVGLITWPVWIKSYTHLTELSISGSSILSIPDDALDMAANTLTTVNFNSNSLTTLPKTLSKLTVLSYLSLEHNKITDITWLPQLSKLNTLLLSNNKIADANKLSNVLRVHAQSMYRFEVHDNSLTSIPDLDFLTQVVSLDFTNNHITDTDSGSAPTGLFDLQLGNNFLSTIPRLMKSLPAVSDLYLKWNHISVLQGTDIPTHSMGADFGYNLITELTRTSFPENSSLTYVIFNSNPINHISPDAFYNLNHLVQLQLQHSKLTRLPLALASMTKINLIDMSGSTELVCTCMEKSLEPMIKAMWPGYFEGNCGLISIYKFFTELSPSCPVL